MLETETECRRLTIPQTGSFIEFITTLVGYNVNKKVNILKGLNGDQPFSTTATVDIGGESTLQQSRAQVLTHPQASSRTS